MWQALIREWRGIAGAMRSRPGVLASVAAAVFALDLFLPPLVLSVVRKPFDYFTFNAWLPNLPAYLVRDNVPIQQKLDFIPNLALFWFSADSPFGGVDWGFAITVADLSRILLLSLLFGIYFALVFHNRDLMPFTPARASFGRSGGVSGALASVLGVSTGGCTVVGCGAPMLPVVGLAFVGLSSGTLVFLAELSRVSTWVVFAAVAGGIAYLAWRSGGASISLR